MKRLVIIFLLLSLTLCGCSLVPPDNIQPSKKGTQKENYDDYFTASQVSSTDLNEIIGRNFARNTSFDNNVTERGVSTRNKLINDQNKRTGERFEYGNYPAKQNACEVIAVHNAKILTGIESSLSETIRDFQKTGLMLGDGALGSNPYKIDDILEKYGMEYTRVKLDEMTEHGIYVVSYWKDGSALNGCHTVAIEYKEDMYITYNLYGDGQIKTLDPKEYAKSYISGYYLGEKKELEVEYESEE